MQVYSTRDVDLCLWTGKQKEGKSLAPRREDGTRGSRRLEHVYTTLMMMIMMMMR